MAGRGPGPTRCSAEKQKVVGGRAGSEPAPTKKPAEHDAIPHGPSQARSAGREERPCVHASSLQTAFNRSETLPQAPNSLFLFWTVHGPFSLFLRAEKEKMGGASAQPSSWLKSPPPVRASKSRPRPSGRAKAAPARRAVSPVPPPWGGPPHNSVKRRTYSWNTSPPLWKS